MRGERERGDGRIFKRGSVYWIAYMSPGPDGRRVELRESAHTDDEKKAGKLLGDRLREVENDRRGVARFQGPKRERATVGELLDALLADFEQREIKGLRRAKNHVRAVREAFGHVRALSVTPDMIRRWIEDRRKPTKDFPNGRKPATINRQTEILARAFRFAVEEGRLNYAPHVPRLAERNARQGFLEKSQMDLLLSKMVDETLADVVRFGYASGWRMGEIRNLRWEFIDQAAREVRLADSKNGEPRVLPLDGPDWQIIERAQARRQFPGAHGPALSEYVFHAGGRPIPETTLRHAWDTARDAAGLPHFVFHDLRRTVARDLIRSGVPELVAQKVTGHLTSNIFRRYAITDEEQKREALNLRREYLAAREKNSNVIGIGSRTKVSDSVN